MADISKIVTTGGDELNLKDAMARGLLNGHSVAKDVPSDAKFTDTTYTFDGTYNASSNKAATVSTVTNAISALDGGTIGTPGTGKTVTALSQTNGNVSATFGDISITKSQISDFPSSMTPASHTHGNIQNGGALQTTDVTIASGDKLVVTDSSDSGKIARTSIAFDGSTTTKALTPKGTWENFTNNTGTITGIKMNGSSKGTSGVVDLGTVITSHQDISGKMNANLKGAANGVAELDANGKVPSSQLPSYVDDVLEYDSLSNFPSTGETGKIYVAKDTNKTYRWSGTAYVEISPSLALGETSSTAYRGDRGKTAYDHSQSTHARTDATAVAASSTNGNIKINGTETTVYTHPGSGTNPHGTTKSDVGLGDVGNFKAVSTVASQGLTDTEKSNARANIGAGTSSLALGTSSSTAYRGDRGNSAYAHAVTNKGSAFTSGLYKITTNSEGHVTAATAVAKSDITGLGIPAQDTTYESKSAASGGTAVSLVTTGEKYTWNNKGSYSKPSGGIPDSDIASASTWNAKGTYSKPSGGIPKTDLASAVQTSLGKADSALQSHQTIKQDGVTGATVNRFGTCSTAAATAAKTVSITTGTFSLEAGAMVAVKFSNANSASSPTLNVASTGAKNIFVNGAQITTNSGAKGLLKGTVIFIYDGTQYHLIGNYYDSNTHRPIQVNGTEILGNNTTALNLKAGSNVTVTNSSGTVTIAATDTTYSSKSAASGGSDVSLVTTGEKYTWNSKGTYSKPSGGIPASDLASGVIPTVPSAYTSNPAMDGTASAGSSGSWAKGDHVHPTDTSRQAKITASGILKGNGSGGISAATAGTDYGTYSKPSGGIPDSDIASASTWNSKATKPDIGTISLTATWAGSGPYTQTVTVSGATVTANSKVDLQPNATAITQMIEDGVQALYIANNNGTLTAYAVGAETSTAMTIQCTVTEVVS